MATDQDDRAEPGASDRQAGAELPDQQDQMARIERLYPADRLDIAKRAKRPPSVPPGPDGKWPGGWTGKGFPPGVSGNPAGTFKRRPITDAIRDELRRPFPGGRRDPNLQVAVANLVRIMTTGKGRDVIEAFKLAMAYTDGPPNQGTDADVYDIAKREAVARGLDPDVVVSLLDNMRAGRRA